MEENFWFCALCRVHRALSLFVVNRLHIDRDRSTQRYVETDRTDRLVLDWYVLLVAHPLFVFVIFVCIPYHPKPENVTSYIHSTWARSFCFLVLSFLPIASCLLKKCEPISTCGMRTQIWQRERGVPFAAEGFKFFNA